VNGEPSPKDRFTSLDTFALVQELRPWTGARVDKVFDAAPSGVSFLFRGTPARRAELTVVPGRFAALRPPEPAHAETLSPFARELRRLLSGATVVRVADPAGERYLEIELSRSGAGGPMVLAIELFGQGNIVVAEGGKVVAVAHSRTWAHRVLRIGAGYVRPPARDDPFGLGVERLRSELEGSRTDLASTVAARLALGGPVAEEVVARGGWSAHVPASSVADEVAPRLHGVLAEIRSEIGEHPRGFVVLRGGEAVDASPYRPVRWAATPGVEVAERPSFSEAAHTYFTTLVPVPPTAEETAQEAERASLRRLEERQRLAVDELREAIASRKRQADRIYAHYAEVEAALGAAHSAPGSPKEVDLTLEGETMRVPVERGVEGAARALYEDAKRLSTKLAGAEEALTATRGRLASDELRPRRRATAESAAPTKLRWFEKYRWFVSSEGVLAIAGRDAPSNDVVVRRHLKAGDRYLHADLQGAASVVVKRPQGSSAEIGEVTLREAAQWAVAYSKAWRAGLASASAFWAEPDQVSKSAESGEFVPKGAWVVRGTKHFVRDVPLELALGTIDYEGERRWTAAPESALRARGELRVLLVPGEERDRSRVEEELVRDLGISRTMLQRLLPAGGLARRA
jgi:predicted ribosome quality control (RQC) complex YloA/Tae2 family protein